MNSYPLVDRIPFPSLEQEGQEHGQGAIVTAAAEATITTTMTQFKTPIAASPVFTSSPPSSLSSIPYYTTTITTTPTSTTHPSPHSAPLELFSFDNTSPWHQLFPALVVFAIIGALSALLLLIFLFFCFYRRQRQRRRHALEENAMDASGRPPLFGHTEKVQTPASTTTTLHHLGIPETINHSPALQYHRHHQQQQVYHQYPTYMLPVSGSAPTTPHHPQRYHYFSTTTPQPAGSSLSSPVSSTFVPIETSPLTLVPRAAIWKDPQRRRGVNELDLWEQKQQQQQQQRLTTTVAHSHIALAPTPSTSSTNDDRVQPIFTPFPFLQHDTPKDDDDDTGSTTTSLDNGRDRPWQRYVQSSSRPVDLSALNDEGDDDDQHSLHSSSTILHPNPIYNLNQEIGDPPTMEAPKNEDITTNGSHRCLENSGSSQWLCPPSTFKS